MRYCLIVFAATMLFAGTLASGADAAPLAASKIKAAAENLTPIETIGCRAEGRKCPMGTQNECKDGRCTCKPCTY